MGEASPYGPRAWVFQSAMAESSGVCLQVPPLDQNEVEGGQLIT